MIEDKKFALIGAGFMGKALLRGLINSDTVQPDQFTVSDMSREALDEIERTGAGVTQDNLAALSDVDIVLLCVKPQIIGNVLDAIAPDFSGDKLLISIAAGVTLSTLTTNLPDRSRVIRAMPNIGADVGQSATALCAGEFCHEDDIVMAREIFDAVGKSVTLDETMMDAVTGLSGSGPAYVFMFLEAMIDAGVRCGIPRQASATLAGQTLLGAVTLAIESGEHPATLRDRVTSPGGTTMAGLSVLESAGFRGAIMDAVESAVARSKQLGE